MQYNSNITGNLDDTIQMRIKKICPICKKTFFVIPSLKNKAVYCSKKCANIGQGKKRLGKILNRRGKLKTCVICGKQYYVSPSRVKITRCCSWKCTNKLKSQRRGKNHPLYKLIDIKCDYCGKEYPEKPAKIKMYANHFCSRRCLGAYTASHQKSPSNIEKKLAGFLIDNGISFSCQFEYRFGVADFFIPPKLIVEVDGDYWHNLPKVKLRDVRQTEFLESEGFDVLHLWEHEINENPDNCVDKILQMSNN